MIDIVIFLALGSVVGFVAGLLGVGGGLIIVPALLYLMDNQPNIMQSAIATSIASIIFTSISSVYIHNKHNAILWKQIKNIAPLLILGVISGVLLLKYLSFTFLKYFFAIFEMIIALSILKIINFNKLGFLFQKSKIFSFLTGLLSSMLGIGGGTLTTPYLLYHQVDVKKAIATSSAIGFIIAVFAVLTFIFDYKSLVLTVIKLDVLIPLVIGSVIFANIGAKTTHKLNDAVLRKIFASLLIMLAFLVMLK